MEKIQLKLTEALLNGYKQVAYKDEKANVIVLLPLKDIYYLYTTDTDYIPAYRKKNLLIPVNDRYIKKSLPAPIDPACDPDEVQTLLERWSQGQFYKTAFKTEIPITELMQAPLTEPWAKVVLTEWFGGVNYSILKKKGRKGEICYIQIRPIADAESRTITITVPIRCERAKQLVKEKPTKLYIRHPRFVFAYIVKKANGKYYGRWEWYIQGTKILWGEYSHPWDYKIVLYKPEDLPTYDTESGDRIIPLLIKHKNLAMVITPSATLRLIEKNNLWNAVITEEVIEKVKEHLNWCSEVDEVLDRVNAKTIGELYEKLKTDRELQSYIPRLYEALKSLQDLGISLKRTTEEEPTKEETNHQDYPTPYYRYNFSEATDPDRQEFIELMEELQYND